MSFVTSEKMLLDAQKGGYAVGAFNVENMEMVMAVIAAAEELRAPLMMQTTPSTIKYAGLEMYLANVKAAAERASVPVCLHLDHGDSFDLAMRALRVGYTSIMIDGSHNVFEENIAVTKAVADACRPSNVPVERNLARWAERKMIWTAETAATQTPRKRRSLWSAPAWAPWQWLSVRLMAYTKESLSWIWIGWQRSAK